MRSIFHLIVMSSYDKVYNMKKPRKGFLYKDKYGHIKGWRDTDGYWYITEFLVYPKYRNQGYGRKLAQHLPNGPCKLYAAPLLTHRPPHISEEKLLDFYQSLGFILQPKEYDGDIRNFMIRPYGT